PTRRALSDAEAPSGEARIHGRVVAGETVGAGEANRAEGPGGAATDRIRTSREPLPRSPVASGPATIRGRKMNGMDTHPDPVETEIERIAGLPPAERAAALEALEARLRATLDDVPSA